MHWIVFACAYPSARSAPRVAVWRRLRRIGAIAPKAGLHVLPATDDCIEAMQWIAREARDDGAEPLVIHADEIEGLSDQQLIELFRAARHEDYEAVATQLDAVEAQLDPGDEAADEALLKARADYQQVQAIDYFPGGDGERVAQRIESMAVRLAGREESAGAIPRAVVAEYRGRKWATRPRPFVDRLACAWLIRRFIDADASIRYGGSVRRGEVAFDLEQGEFGHVGNRCTFEVMIEAFGISKPGLTSIAEIVHEIDLKDGRYLRPETLGVEAVIAGWRREERLTDGELEAAALVLFDGLIEHFSR